MERSSWSADLGDGAASPTDNGSPVGTVTTVTSANVIIHRDKEHLADSAAGRVATILEAGVGDRVSLGLAGGSTPRATYARLRKAPVAWDRVDAWLSDERWVPPGDPDSNGRMAAESLLDHVAARFLRPRWTPWLTAADSAAHYEADLRSIHPSGRSDLILLGMGDDGHTASLFPESAALAASPHRWFVANHVTRLDSDRLTTTFSFLRQARTIMFLVAGSDKAPALRRVLEPGTDEETPPAAGVIGGDADVIWMVDEAAAADLTVTSRVDG